MKRKNAEYRSVFVTREKKLEKVHYKIVIGLMIVFILYYKFIHPKTIGYNFHYTLYIVVLPIIIGILALGYYRRGFLLDKINISKRAFFKIFAGGFYLLQGILFSILSFGLVAIASWDYINKSTADRNPSEIIKCKITKFYSGGARSGPAIEFKYQNRNEKLSINYKTLKKYKDSSPEKYELQISIKRGLWNYCIVNDWTIKNIQ